VTPTIDASDERLRGAVIVASVSGGKDSAAMSLALTAAGLPHKRVFADTGWEHPWTYEYLRGPLTAALGAIDEVRSPAGGMREAILRHGMFPSRLRRYCTSELKSKPLMDFIVTVRDGGADVVNAVGIRAGESEARAKFTPWEWSNEYDCWVWRPLLAWSEQDVIDTHHAHGLRPNPLYLAGATRVGCWPCIFSRKAEIRMVAKLTPERIDEIRELEAKVTATARARGAPEKYLPRTFFHGKRTREGIPHPIDEIVEWSRTAAGGHQGILIDDAPEGCVRWGLCESTEGSEPRA
jgi:3'-phosphoadenosine 5'-phosphosulfate sulfotransferase (PAPS reductase)/FAD synthetase